MTNLRFDRRGGIPKIEVVIGNFQVGDYTFALFDRNDRSVGISGKGTSDDKIQDDFRLVATRDEFAAVDGYTLSWVIWIKARRRGARLRWSYRIKVTQDAELIAEVGDRGGFTRNLHHFDGDFGIQLI